MKVHELLDALEHMPLDALVAFGDGGTPTDIDFVELEEKDNVVVLRPASEAT